MSTLNQWKSLFRRIQTQMKRHGWRSLRNIGTTDGGATIMLAVK